MTLYAVWSRRPPLNTLNTQKRNGQERLSYWPFKAQLSSLSSQLIRLVFGMFSFVLLIWPSANTQSGLMQR